RRTLEELDLYLSLSSDALKTGPADLVVWPETASPLPATDERVLGPALRLEVPMVLGAPGGTPGEQRNSAYGLDGRVAGRQDKRRLVPFGEQLPFESLLRGLYGPVLSRLGLPGFTSVVPGSGLAVLPLRDLRAGISICYESVFPAFSRQAVLSGANLLVVISNDAWFGPGLGAEQHFQMGRLRAIETGRFLLRAGNDGITAAVDPAGRILMRAPRGDRAAFRAPFGQVDTLTPYVQYGDWISRLSVIVLTGLLALRWQAGGRRATGVHP
ncbi:apolipoprotein N-acyltransferase, partial [Deinococcus multiflagellatus]